MENVRKDKRAVPSAAIVGCGNIGSLFDEKAPASFPLTHASAFLKNSGVKLLAASDSNEARLREFGQARGVSKLYSKYEEMFAKEQIDILSVCAHLDSRTAIIKAALESGIRHIICEKPLAMELEEAKAIVAMSEKYGAKINVNFIRRWNKGIEKVKSLLDAAGGAKIQAVTIYYEKGCLNNGSHVVDLLNFFWGSNLKVLSKRNIEDDRIRSKDPSISAHLQIERGGHSINIQMNAVDHRIFSIFEFDILHSAGRIRLLEAGDKIAIYKIVPDKDCPEYPVLTLEQELSNQVADSFPNMIQNMLDVYHRRGELRCSAQSALETLKMVELIRG